MYAFSMHPHQKRAAGELHSLPVHIIKGIKEERGAADVHVSVTHLPDRWIQRNKMEKVNVILAHEGISHDIYTR